MIPGLDGVLIVDKPEGMTSHDVVAAVRRRLPRKIRVGHTGTLDPFATGVLPIVIGKATRLSQFLTAGRKRYRATIAFGTATDSGDRMGLTIETAAPAAVIALDEVAISNALLTLLGSQAQVPPSYSAKKVDGQRAYVLARRGEMVDLPAVDVTAHVLRLVEWTPESRRAIVDLDVSAGYYVRSLARDLGGRLGVPAHLAALQRTASGPWSLDDAHSLSEVLQATTEAFGEICQPMAAALDGWPAVTLDEGQLERVLAGRAVDLTSMQSAALDALPARVRLLDQAGELVALARPATPGTVHADIVLR